MKISQALMIGLVGGLLAACAPVVYVRGGPPAPRYAVVGAAPGPGYVWAQGYWDWRGGAWIWMPGRWALSPGARAYWVPAHWTNRRRGYVFVPGRWRYR